MYLTVAFPVYNVKEYLREAVESVINQSYKDYEILLVDDGSTDGSSELCDQLMAEYPDTIRVIHKENSGSLFTRRVCLLEAQGDFIHIMDADDKLIDIYAYEKIINLLEATSSDMVFFLPTRDENKREPYHPMPYENGQIFENETKKELCKLFVTGTYMNALWNKVFRKSIVDLEEDYSKYINVINGTDVFQVLPIFTNANRIVYLNEVLYYYRITEGSIGRHFNPKMYESIKENSIRLEEYLTKWDLINNDDFHKLLMTKRLSGCTTAANRVKFCNKQDKQIALKYLQSIATDNYFKDVYKYQKELSFGRRIVAILLHFQLYWVVWMIVRRA